MVLLLGREHLEQQLLLEASCLFLQLLPFA